MSDLSPNTEVHKCPYFNDDCPKCNPEQFKPLNDEPDAQPLCSNCQKPAAYHANYTGENPAAGCSAFTPTPRSDDGELEQFMLSQGYTPTDANGFWYKDLVGHLSPGMAQEVHKIYLQARKQAASDIFSLAHEYAQKDTTMIGAEPLRAHHYYNAIQKIGEFDER